MVCADGIGALGRSSARHDRPLQRTELFWLKMGLRTGSGAGRAGFNRGSLKAPPGDGRAMIVPQDVA